MVPLVLPASVQRIPGGELQHSLKGGGPEVASGREKKGERKKEKKRKEKKRKEKEEENQRNFFSDLKKKEMSTWWKCFQ